MSAYPVLLFHSTDDRDLLSLRDLGNMRPELFEELMKQLRKEFDVVGLQEIVGQISGKTRTRERLLALTFDDGPKSYATRAVPVLKAHNLPSTCFLITDCIDDRSIYWRYFYNYSIHKGFSQELAALIHREYQAEIGVEDIGVFSRDNFDMRRNQRIIETMLDTLVPEKEYREREGPLFLSVKDIRTLKESPLVSFGIHTRSHPVLRSLSDNEIRDEIAGSLDFFRGMAGDETPMFSIPFGRPFQDYDERTISVARSLSIDVMLSAYGGANSIGQPLYNIRRISVHEGKLADGIDQFMKTLRDPALPAEYREKEERLSELLPLE